MEWAILLRWGRCDRRDKFYDLFSNKPWLKFLLFCSSSIIPSLRFDSMGRIRHFQAAAGPVYLVSATVVNVRKYAKIPLD